MGSWPRRGRRGPWWGGVSPGGWVPRRWGLGWVPMGGSARGRVSSGGWVSSGAVWRRGVCAEDVSPVAVFTGVDFGGDVSGVGVFTGVAFVATVLVITDSLMMSS